MLNDRAERERWQKSQAADDDDDAEEEAYKQRPVGHQSAGRARDDTLCGERSSDGENRDDDEETAREHGERKCEAPKCRISAQASEGAAIRRRRRCVSVENFRVSMRSGVTQAVKAGLEDAGDSGQTERY